MSIIRTLAATSVVLALSAVPALAHPKLISSVPAADASVAPTSRLDLHFSEALERAFTGATVYAVKPRLMNGKFVDHAVTVSGVTGGLDPADSKTLMLMIPTVLAAGDYKVGWHAVSTDTHRQTGSYRFTVK
ncbi:MAG: copC [Caulobacteraceae bacterium]|nr:copC [Caulobacteraceae bacterium]